MLEVLSASPVQQSRWPRVGVQWPAPVPFPNDRSRALPVVPETGLRRDAARLATASSDESLWGLSIFDAKNADDMDHVPLESVDFLSRSVPVGHLVAWKSNTRSTVRFMTLARQGLAGERQTTMRWAGSGCPSWTGLRRVAASPAHAARLAPKSRARQPRMGRRWVAAPGKGAAPPNSGQRQPPAGAPTRAAVASLWGRSYQRPRVAGGLNVPSPPADVGRNLQSNGLMGLPSFARFLSP